MSNNKWISVAERLPEKDQRVLTWNQIEIQAFTYAGDNKWWDSECWSYTEEWGITHWMPLPESPKESEDTNEN